MHHNPGIYNVRRGHDGDIEAVVTLWQQLPGMVLREEDSPLGVQQFLTNAGGALWIAELGRKVIGAVLVGSDGRRGYLYHLAVDELWQRLGIGGALVDAAVDALVAEGIIRSHVVVVADNAQARSFWERLGWLGRRELVLYTRINGN
jgi:ribosomal protein S18 acetylase RimI-like enzyme